MKSAQKKHKKLCNNTMKKLKNIEKYRKNEHEKKLCGKILVKTVHNSFFECYNKLIDYVLEVISWLKKK